VSDRSRTSLTFRYEALRAIAAGIVETASTTFLVLIAVRWFEAGPLAKGLVASGAGLGYVISPLIVSRVEAARTPVARAASRLALAGAVSLTLSALVPGERLFVVSSLMAIALGGSMTPLLTQIYQDNYPDASRGRYFSRTVMIRIGSAVVFAAGAGYLLSLNIGYFRILLAMFAGALAFSSWCLSRVPSAPLHLSEAQHPLRAFRYVRDDRVFRITLISWMFMGFANLMMLPLRVEYLANPRYALALRPDMIALLTGVVPNLARLVMSPVWGWLFDRMNFFVMRMTLNVGFAIGIISFFASDTTMGFVLAAVTFGVATAGGDVAWTLWVTKVAPPERVADYMSVHTFFTGVRGLIAPLVGFALVAHWSMTTMGWFSAASIIVGSLFLLPDAMKGGPMRKAPANPVAQGAGETGDQ
jgi:predicted MFS family arabinose efflux permease